MLPDYLGFIFYKGSPRWVGDQFDIGNKIPDSIKKVGVFVNEKPAKIREIVKEHGLDLVQLHGDESIDECETLKAENISVIKVFSIHDGFDFGNVVPYQAVVDFLLFDTKGKSYGGNGQSFNWSVLDQYNQHVPFFLSGGLSPENITNIKPLVNLNIHAVDINSGFEIEPGVKDIKKLRNVKSILTSNPDNYRD